MQFLSIRQQLHGRIISGDELEICGGFITGLVNVKTKSKKEVLAFSPMLADIFDKLYYQGLGFREEKQIKRKKSGKYIILGV